MNFKLFFYIFLVLIICSCEDYFDDVKKINFKELIPAGKTQNFVLRYTDSANLKAILKSPLNIDYTNQIFPYSEFPDGIDIEFFDNFFPFEKIGKKIFTSTWRRAFRGG